MRYYRTIKSKQTRDNKNLKGTEGGITIESKETSKHNSSWVASYIHACTNETHLIISLQDLIPTLASLCCP